MSHSDLAGLNLKPVLIGGALVLPECCSPALVVQGRLSFVLITHTYPYAEQPCHNYSPVAGLFILAGSDSEKPAGESSARMARGIAAMPGLTHRRPTVSRTRRVAGLQVRLCWPTTLYG